MQTAHLRNFLYLSRTKIIRVATCVGILWCAFPSFAQQSRNINLENYDRRKIHYGFQAGIFNSFSVLNYSDTFVERDSVLYIDGMNTGGFSLGLIVNVALKDELWDLRFAPNFSFYQREITFSYTEDDQPEPVTDVNILESTMLELPLLFMYKSVRRMNSRMYMVGGVTASFQIGGKVDEANQRAVILNRRNLEISYGLGFHFYMQMFNLAPELRISHGLLNLLNQTNNPYSTNLEGITTHKITLFINFEG